MLAMVTAIVICAQEQAALDIRVGQSGKYTISVNAEVWYHSPDVLMMCTTPLTKQGSVQNEGVDSLGKWAATVVTYTAATTTTAPGLPNAPVVEYAYKRYAAMPEVAVVTTTYLQAVSTRSSCSCGHISNIDRVAGAEVHTRHPHHPQCTRLPFLVHQTVCTFAYARTHAHANG